ncbi:uncharacterized protein FFB20_15904 [Fusarium fujikuroi]|nr:uncharacterized protein FFB20_15904 [Fusarium fujikuroi]
MPLYARNVSAITCLHLVILCLDTCKDISIKDNPIPDVLVAFTGVTPVSHPGQVIPACC